MTTETYTGGSTTGTDSSTGAATTGTDSSTGAAVDQGKQSASQVAGTAADAARDVGRETRRQGRQLVDQTRDELRQQAGQQQERLASGLRSLGDELRTMAGSGTEGSTAHSLVDDAAHRVGDLATWLEHRDPGSVVDEARDFARRKPGTFLAAAAAVGFLGGRLSRGLVDEAREDSPAPGSTPSTGSSSMPASGGPTPATGGTTSGGGTSSGTTSGGGTLSTSGTTALATASGSGDPVPGIDPDPVPGEVPGTPRSGSPTQPTSPTGDVDEPRIARPSAPDGTPTPIRSDGTLGVPDTRRDIEGTP
ncbi:MAG: hypothetical protein ACRCY8_01460 [Dermatophilaceae bacterium]